MALQISHYQRFQQTARLISGSSPHAVAWEELPLPMSGVAACVILRSLNTPQAPTAHSSKGQVIRKIPVCNREPAVRARQHKQSVCTPHAFHNTAGPYRVLRWLARERSGASDQPLKSGYRVEIEQSRCQDRAACRQWRRSHFSKENQEHERT